MLYRKHTLKDIAMEGWDALRQLSVSLAVAAGAFGVTTFLLTQTTYGLFIEELLLNGWGPYQIAVLIGLLSITFYYIKGLLSTIWRFITEPVFVDIDKVIWAFLLWGVPWFLIPSSFIDWGKIPNLIALIQILWWGMLCLILTRLIVVFRANRQQYVLEKPRWLHDHPIDSEKEDILRRENIVRQIVSAIDDYSFEGSFVIALTGEWGSGKSSVLNLSKIQFKKKGISTLEFSPWYLSTGSDQNLEGILRYFFDVLKRAANESAFRPNLLQTISKYSKLLEIALSASSINLSLTTGPNPNELTELREQLSKGFSALKQKFVVIIDDLDRMSGTEIAYVFKLVRLCADFKNVIYLIAFDRSFVEEQLEEGFHSRARDYIDKIVQLEIPLPRADTSAVIYFLQNRFQDMERELNVQLISDTKFQKRLAENADVWRNWLGNLRLAKTLTNRFLLAVLPIIGEVNYYDLLVLEGVRLKHPDIYEFIFWHPSLFTYENPVNWMMPASQQESQMLAKNYDGMLDEIEDAERDGIKKLIGSVFNSARSYFYQSNTLVPRYSDQEAFLSKSASHPYYFPRYFCFAIQTGAISDVKWDEFIVAINSAHDFGDVKILVEESINSARESKIVDKWLMMMRAHAPRIQEEAIGGVILGVSDYMGTFSDAYPDSIFSEHFEAGLLIDNLFRRLKLESIETIAIQVIESCPDIGYLVPFMYLFDPVSKNRNVIQSVSLENLKQTGQKRLEATYLTLKRNILDETHHHGGIVAFKYFLPPQISKEYIRDLVSQDKQNLLKFCRLCVIGGGVDFATVKFFFDNLKEMVDVVKELAHLDRDKIIVSLLEKGVEHTEAGNNVDTISPVDL